MKMLQLIAAAATLSQTTAVDVSELKTLESVMQEFMSYTASNTLPDDLEIETTLPRLR